MIDVATWETFCNRFRDEFHIVESVYPIDILDMQTATEEIRKLKSPILVCEDFTVSTIAHKADNINDNFMLALLVLEKFTVRNNKAADKSALLQSTYSSIKEIKNLMIAGKLSTCEFVSGLNIESMLIEKVGPVLDQHYGWRLSFDIITPT